MFLFCLPFELYKRVISLKRGARNYFNTNLWGLLFLLLAGKKSDHKAMLSQLLKAVAFAFGK